MSHAGIAVMAIPKTTTNVQGPQPRRSCRRLLIHSASVGSTDSVWCMSTELRGSSSTMGRCIGNQAAVPRAGAYLIEYFFS